MTDRKAAEAFIVENIAKLTPGSANKDMYVKLFSTMNDNDFQSFMEDLESGKKFLTVVESNFNDSVTVENNLKLGDELGHNFFQRLWIEGNEEDEPTYLTPNEYLIVDLPLRRVSQTLLKKISIPNDTKSTDKLTAQYVGKPAGAGMSYPELQMASAMGFENSMVELIKFRGGDVKGKVAYEKSLSETGKADLDILERQGSGVESTKTLKTFLTAAHLGNTL